MNRDPGRYELPPLRDDLASDVEWVGELLATQENGVKYTVDRLLVPGLNVLAAPPKDGKSCLALELLIAVERGTLALGERETLRGAGLYIALESSRRQIKERILGIVGAGALPERIAMAYTWPRLLDGAEARLEAWLDAHPDARLVVIDVLEHLMPPAREGVLLYRQEYAAVSPIARLARQRGVALLAVTHTRQGQGGRAPERINSSQGLVGASDANLVLLPARGGYTLDVEGNDLPDQKLTLAFDYPRWRIVPAPEKKIKAEKAPKPQSDAARIREYLQSCEGIPTAPEIAAATGAKAATVRKTLERMRDSA